MQKEDPASKVGTMDAKGKPLQAGLVMLPPMPLLLAATLCAVNDPPLLYFSTTVACKQQHLLWDISLSLPCLLNPVYKAKSCIGGQGS